MDDFEYSVQISELDWDSFFQVCEECNIFPPVLAGLDDSGMSDIDERGSQQTQPDIQGKTPDPELPIDGPPDCDGSPVDFYLSKYGLRSPEQVLSGSEEDFQMEAVNVFFEKFKSVSKDTTKSHTNEDSKISKPSFVSVENEAGKEAALSVKVSQPYSNQLVQKNYSHFCTHKESTDDDLEEEKLTFTYPDTKLFITEENWSLEILKDGVKWDEEVNCDDLCHKMMPKQDIKKTSCNVLVKGTDLTNPNQEKEPNSQLTITSAYENELTVDQSQASSVTPRRKRRKKKRASTELVETDHVYEAQLKSKHGESDEDTYMRRGERLRGTSTSEYCSSGIVPEPSTKSQSSSSFSKVSASETFTVFQQPFPEKTDVWNATMECTISPKPYEELPSAVGVTQSKRETDLLRESNLIGKPASAGQLAMKVYDKSPESGVSVKATSQSSVSTSTPTSGDDARNRLQLKTHLTSEINTVPKSADSVPLAVSTSDTRKAVSETENRKQGRMENLTFCSIELKEDIKLSMSNSFDESGDVCQKQTSISDNISCVPFPVLTEQTFSVPHNNVVMTEILPCKTHAKVQSEHGNGHDLQAKESLTETSDSDLPKKSNCDQISPQNPQTNVRNAQIQVTQNSLTGMSTNTDAMEAKSEIKDQASKKAAISNVSSDVKPPFHLQHEEISDRPNSENDIDTKETEIISTGAEFVEKEDGEILSSVTEDFSVKHKETIGNIHIEHAENLCFVTEDINTKDVEILSMDTEDVNTKHEKIIYPVTKDVNTKDAEMISLVANDLNRKNPTDVRVLSSCAEVGSESMSKECKLLTQVAEPESQLPGGSELESTPSHVHAPGEGQEGQMEYINRPYDLSTKDHEPSVLQGEPMTTPDSTDEAISLETAGSDTPSQPTNPVFTISSFWDEMEKLTINDILRLRLVGQTQHPSVLVQLEDSSIADVTDAADSGYFTHLDEIKPDHSSGDMSFVSDFDEDLALTPDATKPDEGSGESPNPSGIIWESDPDMSASGVAKEDVFNSELTLPPPLHKDNSHHCFRKMCKNISVQNLQSLEAQPFRKIQRNASLHSIHSVHSIHPEDEDDYVDPFDHPDTSSPLYSSDDEEDMDSTGITFSEILQYLFGSDEPESSASASDTTATSYLSGTEASVPETYDHFFSEYEAESLFFPITEDNSSSKDEMIPIFSCSRSYNRSLQFPEAYDYFFPDDSPVSSDEDEESDHTVIQVITRHDHMATKNHGAVASSDTFEHLLPEKDDGWNFLRNNPFSFRRIRRTGFILPHETPSPLPLTPVQSTGRSFRGGIQPINAFGVDYSPFPDPLLLSLENSIFRQLAEQQKICREIQTAVADPRVDAPLLPFKQTDMCLVCIAFASWVLKSVNPQGADTWKAVLLANISALSAIRYLRRFKRDEAAKITPLPQIEPA